MREGRGLRPAPFLGNEAFINDSKKSALLMGAGTVSVAALIVAKMFALDWAGRKLQGALGKGKPSH